MCCPFVRRTIALVLAASVALGGLAADARADDRRDHDAARQAVERGEIKALADILNAIRGKLPGEVVGIEIERKKGRWLYELRVADSRGRLFEVDVDATTGMIERVKEK